MQAETGNIRVFARVRPLNQKEISEEGKTLCIDELTPETIKLKQSSSINANQQTRFSFDQVFGYESTQEEVFSMVGKNLVDTVFQGINGTVFAYGQTSSGKTFTCMGPDIQDNKLKGLLPRVVEQAFAKILGAPDHIEFRIKISLVEIYNEKIKDLLDSSKVDLKIRESKTRGIYIQDVTEVYVSSIEEVLNYVKLGGSNRAIAQTMMSSVSSRSHMLFFMTVSQNDLKELSAKSGRFTLIDLAGSEKISKTGAEGRQLEEAKNINKSLSSLGNVINALTEGKISHVPYRDSKLTRILQESLGGNAKTNLIINISPSIFNDAESLNTLRFGYRAKNIKNKPKVNKQYTVPELLLLLEKAEEKIKDYQRTIKELNKRLSGQEQKGLPKLMVRDSKKHIESDDQEDKKQQTQPPEQQVVIPTEKPVLNENRVNIAKQNEISIEQRIQSVRKQYNQKIQVLLDNLDEMTGENTELGRNLELANEKYDKIRTEAYHLQAKLMTVQKQNQIFLEKQVAFQLENEELKESVMELQDKIQVYQEKEKQMLLEADRMRAEGQKLNLNGDSMRKTRVFEIGQTKSMIKKENGVSEEISQKQVEQLRARVMRLEEENHMFSHLEEQKERLIAQKLEFDSQRMRMMHDLENRIQKVVELEEEIDNEREKRQHLMQIMEMEEKSKAKRIVTLEAYINEISTSYYVLKNQQASWKSENRVYESKLKRKSDRVSELEREISSLKEALYIQKLKYEELVEKEESRSNILDIKLDQPQQTAPNRQSQDKLENKKIVKVLKASMLKNTGGSFIRSQPTDLKKTESAQINQF